MELNLNLLEKDLPIKEADIINLMGFEFEGYTPKISENDMLHFKNEVEKEGWNFGGDGSIHPTGTNDSDRRIFKTYELRTKPIPYKDKKLIVKKYKELVNKYELMVNRSCGLHVHISFNNYENFKKLTSLDFERYFKKEYEKKFKGDKDALDRENSTFCKFSSDNISEYMRLKNYNFNRDNYYGGRQRYLAVNPNSYLEHKTLEFRIFKATTDYKYVEKVIDFVYGVVNNYIKKISPKKVYNKNDILKEDKIRKINKVFVV